MKQETIYFIAEGSIIGSPAAIRAYWAHEAKKRPCLVCGVCTPEKPAA